MSEEIKLHATMDANIWATEFVRLYNKFGYPIDIDTMRGWFANSIMCGYDHAHWKLNPEIDSLCRHVVELEAERDAYREAATAVWRANGLTITWDLELLDMKVAEILKAKQQCEDAQPDDKGGKGT